MRLSSAEYDQLLARNPKLRPTDPQPAKGVALVSPVSGKAKGRNRPARSLKPTSRKRIVFTVYSVRPCDWDGYHIKELQDLLVHAGILDSDDWSSLRGEIVSEKVYEKEEERTEVTITSP